MTGPIWWKPWKANLRAARAILGYDETVFSVFRYEAPLITSNALVGMKLEKYYRASTSLLAVLLD
ncbi:60S ribosome biogenesis protein Rrp14 [Aspergillus luchuensis]|uniref:60S ribosome biogenesis protein Rrp14 n=1 Tax=Aspergillus kawachii TaxID=1069201 RepID=A0A146FY00_ASPKA|nr:60S ribosome biogenesis protein Rrp14 [Aspergillus luchuensis]